MTVNGPSDHLGWAKRPRSRMAIAWVRDLAKKDRRFRAIWKGLIEGGVAHANGRARQIWTGFQWEVVDG